MLFEYQEMSLADIASACEVDVGTVKSRLHRARERLRRALTPFLAGRGGRRGPARTEGRRGHDGTGRRPGPGARAAARPLERPGRAGGHGRARARAPTAARCEAAEPWWSRLFTASVRVPLPVAVGLLMLLVVTAALALRPVSQPPTAGTAGRVEPVQAARATSTRRS